MAITFELVNGEKPASDDFTAWVPGWWYRTAGLPLKTGDLSGRYLWILAGWFLSEEQPSVVIERFLKNGDVETLFNADGQFLLVIYDRSWRSVKIYRDRTGMLPLVYGSGKKGFACSIWIENVRSLTGIEGKASKEVLDELPVYRITLPPASIIDKVKSLSGKCSLNIDDKGFTLNEHPMVPSKDTRYNTLKAASDDFGETLSKSVIKRIDGLKDIGVWLSGGNDSSLLVALLRKYFNGNVSTIFVTFEDYDRDYRKYAREVASRFETDHSEVVVGVKDYLNLWAKTIHIIQEPINGPGTIGQVAALKQVSPSVEILLHGDGADTIFGGPYWAPMLYMSYLGGALPRPFRRYLTHVSKNMHEKSFLFKAIAKSLKALGTSLKDYLHSEIVFGAEEQIDEVFVRETWRHTVDDFQRHIKGDPLSDVLLFLLLHWHSIWIGSFKRLGFYFDVPYVFPFMDYELLKYSVRLPVHLRYHYATKKAPLMKYAEGFFNKRFIYKPKEGFGVPLKKWFYLPDSTPFLNLPLEERSLRRGWWKENELKKVIDLHKSGQGTDESAESIPWITTNLELWARICLEGDSPDLYKLSS
ncbi:MAG: asparagine synthase-related protein [Syntrophales bacterium]|nr:asparagine synthase-related protein [Syntrophales bacterium]